MTQLMTQLMTQHNKNYSANLPFGRSASLVISVAWSPNNDYPCEVNLENNIFHLLTKAKMKDISVSYRLMSCMRQSGLWGLKLGGMNPPNISPRDTLRPSR